MNPRWAKFAYPSLKGLSAWFSDLVARVDQLMEWTTALSLLKSAVRALALALTFGVRRWRKRTNFRCDVNVLAGNRPLPLYTLQ